MSQRGETPASCMKSNIFLFFSFFWGVVFQDGQPAGRSCRWPPGGRWWNCTGTSNTPACFQCDRRSHPGQDSPDVPKHLRLPWVALPVCRRHFLFAGRSSGFVGCSSHTSCPLLCLLDALPACPRHFLFVGGEDASSLPVVTSCLSEALPAWVTTRLISGALSSRF